MEEEPPGSGLTDELLFIGPLTLKGRHLRLWQRPIPVPWVFVSLSFPPSTLWDQQGGSMGIR